MEKRRIHLKSELTYDSIPAFIYSLKSLRNEEEIEFNYRQNGELHIGIVGKGKYNDFYDCVYYIELGKITNLFYSEDECCRFLKHLLKYS